MPVEDATSIPRLFLISFLIIDFILSPFVARYLLTRIAKIKISYWWCLLYINVVGFTVERVDQFLLWLYNCNDHSNTLYCKMYYSKSIWNFTMTIWQLPLSLLFLYILVKFIKKQNIRTKQYIEVVILFLIYKRLEGVVLFWNMFQ